MVDSGSPDVRAGIFLALFIFSTQAADAQERGRGREGRDVERRQAEARRADIAATKAREAGRARETAQRQQADKSRADVQKTAADARARQQAQQAGAALARAGVTHTNGTPGPTAPHLKKGEGSGRARSVGLPGQK